MPRPKRLESIKIRDVATTTLGKVIEIAVNYSEGGTNYFSDTTGNPRGIFLHATPVTIRTMPGMQPMRSVQLFEGVKKRLKTVSRYSEKQLRESAAPFFNDPQLFRELLDEAAKRSKLVLDLIDDDLDLASIEMIYGKSPAPQAA